MEREKGGRSERTRRKIAQALLGLMEGKRFDKITVQEVARTAGVTRGTFYLYYSSIYDLLQEIEDSLIARMCFCLPKPDWESASPSAGAVDGVTEWFEFCRANGDVLLAVTGENGDPYFEHRLRKKLREGIHNMMDCDQMPRDYLRPYYVEMMVSVHLTLVHFWLEQDRRGEKSPNSELLAYMGNLVRAGALLTRRQAARQVRLRESETGGEAPGSAGNDG